MFDDMILSVIRLNNLHIHTDCHHLSDESPEDLCIETPDISGVYYLSSKGCVDREEKRTRCCLK